MSPIIKCVITFITSLARCQILIKWKHKSPSTINGWLQEILLNINFKDVYFILQPLGHKCDSTVHGIVQGKVF